VSAALRLASATLVAQHATLEASNRDLVVHEEEIARHNEQLRSQSEALEHQSEELRVANDDLASRERILARLLSLSRALASELSAEDVMATICEALAELIGEQAEAALVPTVGAALVLEKPVEPTTLVASIRRLVDEARRRST
jgi:hypothetical protein